MNRNKEKIEFILAYACKLKQSKAVLNKVAMYIRQDGLMRTLQYLFKVTKNDKNKTNVQKEFVGRYICAYLKNNLVGKSMEDTFDITEVCNTNSQYMRSERMAIDLIETTLRVFESIKTSTIIEEAMEKNLKSICVKFDNENEGIQYPYWRKTYKEQINIEQKISDDLVEHLKEKQEKIIKMYTNKDYKPLIIKVSSICGSRMIVGIGEPSVEEINFHLNYLYRVPELPATAIKGVFRHFCNKFIEQEGLVEDWFGEETTQGKIIFADSIPIRYEIKNDIISNQYKDYYKEENNEFPKQMSPNIITYYSLNIEEMDIVLLVHDTIDGNVVKNYFLECLKQCSFGARGAVGYGYINEYKSN